MMFNSLRISCIAIALALLGGCAATITRDTVNSAKLRVSPEASKKIVLNMTAPKGGALDDDWQAFQEEWQTSMTAAASASGATFEMASSRDPNTSPPYVLLKMQVNDYRYVSQAKRYVIGVFSGNAYFDVNVDFIEVPGGTDLGERKYSSSSSFMQGVFSAMTPKQVEEAAKEIVEEIESH